MLRYLSIVAAALLTSAAPSLLAQNSGPIYDLVIANGRAMDPESRLDGIRHVGIDGGKIVAISEAPLAGKLQIDATVADQYITYPTDTGLLRQSTKQCEKLIDILYKLQGKKETKPRTYRRKLDKCFLVFSKKRKKTKNEIRKKK